MSIFDTFASEQQLQESLSAQEQAKYDEMSQRVERLAEIIERLYTTGEQATAGDDLPALPHTGDIILSLNNQTIPEGWLKCDGSEVSKIQYTELYQVVGNRFGTPRQQADSFVLPKPLHLPYSLAVDTGMAIWIIRT